MRMQSDQTAFSHGRPSTPHALPGVCLGRRRFLQNGLALAAIPLIGAPEAGAQAWSAAIPGGFAVLALGPDLTAPIARFNDERVLVSGDRNGWLALIGIPLDSKPGRSPPVTIERASGKSASVYFTITDKRYDSENLLIKSDWVDLTETEVARYDAEREHLEDVLRLYSESAPASLLLAAPCRGNPSSTFGLVRSFNGRPRNPHTGLDIAAPVDTAVVSAGYGRVADIGDYFLLGRTVTVNHGRGFMTLCAHLSEIEVNPRKRIKPGQRIGKVGTTGRVTGPHLHFAVYLNATAVDPRFFLSGSYRTAPRLAVIHI
jgi:murein DD-endopeptidase MepM/ murein hydrolase activator NlpD